MASLNKFRHNLIRLNKEQASSSSKPQSFGTAEQVEEVDQFFDVDHTSHDRPPSHPVAYSPPTGLNLFGEHFEPGSPIDLSTFRKYVHHTEPASLPAHIIEKASEEVGTRVSKSDYLKVGFHEIMKRIADMGGWSIGIDPETKQHVYFTGSEEGYEMVPLGAESEKAIKKYLSEKVPPSSEWKSKAKQFPRLDKMEEGWLRPHHTEKEKELLDKYNEAVGLFNQVREAAQGPAHPATVGIGSEESYESNIVTQVLTALETGDEEQIHQALDQVPGLEGNITRGFVEKLTLLPSLGRRIAQLENISDRLSNLPVDLETPKQAIEFGEISKDWFTTATDVANIVSAPQYLHDPHLSPLRFLGLLAATSSGNNPKVETIEALTIWNEWVNKKEDPEFIGKIKQTKTKRERASVINEWIISLSLPLQDEPALLTPSKTLFDIKDPKKPKNAAYALAASLDELASLRNNVITAEGSTSYKIENMRKGFITHYLLGLDDPYADAIFDEPDIDKDVVIDLWIARVLGKPANPSSLEYITHELHWRNLVDTINKEREEEGDEPLKYREAMAAAWAGLRYVVDISADPSVKTKTKKEALALLQDLVEGDFTLQQSDDFLKLMAEDKDVIKLLDRFAGQRKLDPLSERALKNVRQKQRAASTEVNAGIRSELTESRRTADALKDDPTTNIGKRDIARTEGTEIQEEEIDSEALRRFASLVDIYAGEKRKSLSSIADIAHKDTSRENLKSGLERWLSGKLSESQLKPRNNAVWNWALPPTVNKAGSGVKSTMNYVKKLGRQVEGLAGESRREELRDFYNLVLTDLVSAAMGKLRRKSSKQGGDFSYIRDFRQQWLENLTVAEQTDSTSRLHSMWSRKVPLPEKEASVEIAEREGRKNRARRGEEYPTPREAFHTLFTEQEVQTIVNSAVDRFKESRGVHPATVEMAKLRRNLVQLASSYVGQGDKRDADATFEDAYGAYQTEDHQSYVDRLHELGSNIGFQGHQTHKGLTDWGEGATAGVVQIIPEYKNPDFVDYAAAWHGLQGNQNTVMSFIGNGNGPDSVYTFKVPEKDLNILRQDMDTLGINERTMVNSEDGHHIVIFDPETQLKQQVGQLASKYNARVRQSKGNGKFYGGSSGKSARAEYRKLIRSIEEQYGDAIRAYRPTTSLGDFSKEVSTGEPTVSVTASEQANFPVVPI